MENELKAIIQAYKEVLLPYTNKARNLKRKYWDDKSYVDRREKLMITGLILFTLSLLKKK